ncbi:MAG: AI-2E family transporter [Anaerovoracaceae bacterium]|nr:AI-2E family transporter [Bacillota bacterium]MDY2669951.1 AI-2E family transporter [Anaerovoracaceae bacterium]
MSEKTRKKMKRSRWLKLTLSLCIAVVVYLFLSHIDLLFTGLGNFVDFIWPVIVGLVMAYVMDPLAKLFENRIFIRIRSEKTRRTLSVVCTIAAVIVFITLLLVILIPQLVSSVTFFIRNIDNYVEQLQNLANEAAGKSAAKNINIDKFTAAGNDLLNRVASDITGSAGSMLDKSVSLGASLFNTIISFILAIYFLADKKRLLNGCARLMRVVMSDEVYSRTTGFLSRCNDILVRYIAFDIVDGIVIGLINYVFMLMIGYPYRALISIIVGVTNLAPTFGPIAGCVIGAFILLMVNPWYALVFIIFTIFLQTFDGYIFKPKLFGGTLGVSAIWILICIIVGGRMFGVWGILLGIPAAAILDFVYQEMVMKWLEQRKANKLQEKAEIQEKADSASSGGNVSAEEGAAHDGSADRVPDGKTVE